MYTIFLWVFVIIASIYIWIWNTYAYWKRHNVPFVKPLPILGNLKDLLLLRTSFGELFHKFHTIASKNESPILGIFILHTPALLIHDPELIRLIFVKNFKSFPNRYEAADDKHDVLGSLILPLAKYPHWHTSRRELSYFFTSGKLKENLLPLMNIIAEDLDDYLLRIFKAKGKDFCIIDVHEMCSLYVTDVITLIFFGINGCSLKDSNSIIRQHCRLLLKPTFLKVLQFLVIFFLPGYAGIIRAKVFPNDYIDFVRQHLVRKRSAPSSRYFIDMLLHDANEMDENREKYSVAQAAIFLLAGFETSATVMSLILYELAKHPLMLAKLQSEIRNTFNQIKCETIHSLSYEILQNMKFLDMVVLEGLRLYPAAAFINRECILENNDSVFSLEPFTKFKIPHSMPAYVSILGLQRDPKYWPNPNTFNPERFSSKNLENINSMTYIPFGIGPHRCIGSKVGIMQIKIGLIKILRKYSIETTENTIKTIKFNPKSFMLQSEEEIFLKFTKINNEIN